MGFKTILQLLSIDDEAKQEMAKANKNPNNFKVILLTSPNIVDSKNQSTKEDQRFPLTGTIEQAGNSSITTRSTKAGTLRPGNSRNYFQKRFERVSDQRAVDHLPQLDLLRAMSAL